MSPQPLTSASDIAEVIKSGVRKGQGMYVPYARKWEIGGCAPIHSLRTYPYDGVQVLSEGVVRLGWTVRAAESGIVLDSGVLTAWVAANRSLRGEGPPDAYLLGRGGEDSARYTGNAPEVIIALLEGLSSPVPPIPKDPTLKVGFPGLPDRGVTYVGSWQWNIHGEVRDDEFVRRAAAATLAAIRAKEATDAG